MSLRKAIFNVCDPQEPLKPDDPRYVECSEERGSVYLLDSLAGVIQLSVGDTCQLLSGHRGCGKTTELYRLKHRLLNSDQPHFVVYCEADQYTDLNDVEYTDVLLAVVQQLWQDAAREGVCLDPGRLRTFVEDLKNVLLAPVEISKVDVGAGIAKISAEVKMTPGNRQLVREHLRPRATNFMEAINEVVTQANEALKGKGYGGLTVIVDNLDRMFRNPLPNIARTTHEAFFIDAADRLRELACDVVYTVPPAMLYSPSGPRLAGLYGTPPQMLPMIPVATRSGGVNQAGLAKLKEAVERRLRFVGAELDEVFDSEQTVERLCIASGGYMRALLTLLRTALGYVRDLPITSAAAEETVRGERNRFMTSINRPQQWEVLRGVAESKQIGDEEHYLQMLENFVLLEYLDSDGPWYDTNPVIREARQFRKT